MRSAALLAAIALASPCGQAELVGEHVAILGSNDALVVHLSDNQPESCHELFAVRLGATSSQIFPESVGYAEGCWYVTRQGTVVIDAKTFREHMPVHLEYRVADFITTPALKDWARFTGF